MLRLALLAAAALLLSARAAQAVTCTTLTVVDGCPVYAEGILNTLLSAGDGSATAPGLAFANAQNTGFYRNSGTGGVDVSVLGALAAEFGPTGLNMESLAITAASAITASGILTATGGVKAPAGVLATDSLTTQLLYFGNTGDTSYGPLQTVIPFAGLSVRSPVSGCGDQGSALSAITSWAINTPAAGLATHTGPCQNTLAEIAAGGNFDSEALGIQNGGGFPVLQPGLATTPYDATHVYFSPNLTAAQIRQLPLNTYVLTNSVDGSGNPYGSYIVSVASNGSSAQVVGWAALGSNNTATGQTPSTTYKAGTGSSPQAYFGAAVNLFGENTVCGNTAWPMLQSVQCYEVDVVPVSGGSGPIYGMVFENLGDATGGAAGTGIIFPANTYSFYNDITLLGFTNNGLTIAPSSSPTGSGVYIYMQTGTPITIACATGGTTCNGFANAFTLDGLGNLNMAGGATINNGENLIGSLSVTGNGQFSGEVNVGGYLGLHTAVGSSFGSGCSPGTKGYATNGRKPGEGAGSGTGVEVVCTLSSGVPTWFSLFSSPASALTY